MHREVVALGIDKGTYYGLNETGSRIWALMEEPARVGAICEKLIAEFEVDRDACEIQVLNILTEMRAEGMVEVREEVNQPVSREARVRDAGAL
jgi:hypothetical protein